jgi:hypothetical protein
MTKDKITYEELLESTRYLELELSQNGYGSLNELEDTDYFEIQEWLKARSPEQIKEDKEAIYEKDGQKSLAMFLHSALGT